MSALVVPCVRTFPNNSAIAPNLRVMLSGGFLVAATAAGDEIGITEGRTLATNPVGAVRLPAIHETVEVTAAGAITQYANIFAAAGGKVTATDSGQRWGIALQAASGDGSVIEALRISEAQSGDIVTGSITGGDASLGITGQAAATATSAGGAIVGAGAAGGATSGTGGAVSWTGGAGTAGNSAGGAASVVGGAGQGSANGGASAVTGGVGGATGTGGAASLTGGASAGAGGTAGSVTISSGAATGGTEGSVNVQGVATGKLGFFGVSAGTRAGAYTQTYATADKTQANLTVGSDIAAFTDPPSAAEMALLRTFVNALKADLTDVKQITNSIIDDLQAYGLFQ